MKIINFNGSELTPEIGNCNFPGNISGGLSCQIVLPASSDTIRCVIEVATTTGAQNIRGTLTLIDNNTGGPGQTLDAQ